MIIGITGFLGAGKSAVSEIYLQYGFQKVGFGDQVRAEATFQGIEPTRYNLQKLGDDFRQLHGGDIWARRIVENIKPKQHYVIEGIRNPEEITYFQSQGEFYLIGLDAPFTIRANRVLSRARSGDPTTIDAFFESDLIDRGVKRTEFGQNSQKCYDIADFYLYNDGTLEELQQNALEILEKIKKPSPL